MKALVSAAAVATLLALPASAQDRPATLGIGAAPMASVDPQMMIYRVAGVTNSTHTTAAGIATSFQCYNNSSVTENVRIRILNSSGIVKADLNFYIPPKKTYTASTHNTSVFYEEIILTSGTSISQGAAAIIATNRDIYCSAMIVDAAATIPNGIALHMVRFNPQPGSVE
ncbi:hypothetical protein [Mesorhizobium australicum]|uniref:Uncharacterized protein n=1 Tax=Mesorhizobium australicum TaxID=536018 RepID=A0A1X7N467_9HYPH|nr:hypothetical protein [Mesorhizobium australicum]SMH32159.1 hypothetical protein SAMN02982922_1248 [Mesorhizobium australicum]